MRRFGRIVWQVVSVFAAINFAFYGIKSAGAWAGFNAAPDPSLSTQALAFLGATMLMLEVAFPSLSEKKRC